MQVAKSKHHIGIFRSKAFIFCVSIVAKGYCQNICLIWVLFVTAILTTALLKENSTNSLKVETKSDRYLQMPFLDI